MQVIKWFRRMLFGRMVFIGLLSLVFAVEVSAGVEGVAEPVVSIVNYEFVPKEITVHKGQKILWVNNEKRQYHSVWFEESGDPEPQYFFPDESYTREFSEVGSFNYRCGPHPKMTGIVHVIE